MPVARKVWQPILTARAEIGGAALDHAPGVDAVHRLVGQRAGAADGGAEEGALPPSRMPAASI